MLDWGRQRGIYAGGFRAGRLEDHARTLTLNLGLRYELFTQPVDARDLGSLFNITERPVRAARQERLQPRDRGWRSQQFRPARRLRLAGHAKTRAARRLRHFLSASAIRTQQVTQFSGNLPNVPVVSLPTVSATQTVTPPYHDQHADPGRAHRPVARLVYRRQSVRRNHPLGQGFHDSRDPMLHQFNFDIQYQVTSSLLLESLLQRRAGPRSLESCSSTRIRFRSRRRCREQQAGQPSVPEHQRDGDPDASRPRPTTTTPSISAWRSATRKVSRCW